MEMARERWGWRSGDFVTSEGSVEATQSEKGLRGTSSLILTHWLQTWALQNFVRINLCCFKRGMCSNMYGSPWGKLYFFSDTIKKLLPPPNYYRPIAIQVFGSKVYYIAKSCYFSTLTNFLLLLGAKLSDVKECDHTAPNSLIKTLKKLAQHWMQPPHPQSKVTPLGWGGWVPLKFPHI